MKHRFLSQSLDSVNVSWVPFVDTEIENVKVLGVYWRRKASIRFTTHIHDARRFEICYRADGHQTYVVGGRPYRMTSGDVLIIRPGDEHRAEPFPMERGTEYSIRFQLPESPAHFINLLPPHGPNLLRELLAMPHRHFKGCNEMTKDLDAMILTYNTRQGDPLAMLAIHNHLIAFLLKVVQCSRESQTTRLTPPIRKIVNHIARQPDVPITLAQMAHMASLSVSRFMARFHTEVGEAPAKYALRMRVEAAVPLLRDPDISITDIAFRLGFSSSQHFAAAFKDHTGMSPRQFRKSDATSSWQKTYPNTR